MSSSTKAAIHLEPKKTENVEVYKKTNFEDIQNLFGITYKLISCHPGEILNVKPIASTNPSWTRSLLSHDQMDKGDSACLFRLWSMLGEDVGSFTRFLRGVAGNRWRTN